MLSNPPEPSRRPRAALVALAAAAVVIGSLLSAAGPVVPAGAQEGVGGSSGDPSGQATTTVQLENCAPGHIVRLPNCGREPQSPTDPGGWLQVSLFFMICGVLLAIMGFVWWRSRVARRARADAGQDPLSRARATGQGMRRSTRNEPEADTSANRPEANAGR